MSGKIKSRSNEEGQATVEYILILSIVVGVFLALTQSAGLTGLGPSLINSFSKDFAHAYQYGNPKTLGYGENDGPKYHPRVIGGDETNFRIFIVQTAGDGDGSQ